MDKLTKNFCLEKYGLRVRLVDSTDAEFILSLRTNPKLSRYIHNTKDDLERQIKWISDYKDREAAGQEYYFIYYCEGNPIGVNRIYDIHETWATGGSWICAIGCSPQQSVGTSLICRDIMFDYLGLSEDRFDVRKENKLVVRMHKMFGAIIIEESDIDYKFLLKKEVYNNNKGRILRLLNIH